MAKTSIVDEIEHHPQFCLDLSDPLGAIRMGNSIGRFGDRHPAPALGFNARDRYFISGGHSTKAFMRSWKMPSRAAFDIDILVMAAPNTGYRITGAAGRSPPVFCRSVADYGT